ncbi:unnamed protein product [Porites lobata]|uniref:Acetylserotonin O-methyltransferase n=1 Tax=Porites lobata TaxID=104759 RepID=A0ABN8S3G4_9CNID|nr:unnamed protein product [Porites lobata]
MRETKKTQVPSPMPEKFYRLIDGFRLYFSENCRWVPLSKALFAACELEVFDKLRSASSPQSADDITTALSSDLDATTRLMDTLVAMELLEKFKQGDQWLYSNSEMATKFLTKDSPDSYLDMIALINKTLYPIFGNLESAVLEGTTQWKKTFGMSAEDWFPNVCNTEEAKLRFMGAMHCNSLYASYAAVKAIDLSAYRSCCDLGGAVGTLAYALCQFYPEMKITVCDLEPAVSLAHHFRPSVEACPNQANVSFAVGDFFKPETIPKAELYVLSHVLHDWSEDKVDLILSNVYKCLPSGGGLLICERILNEDKRGPTLIFSLLMLVSTGGKERSAPEFKHLLEKHGFIDVQAKRVYFTQDAIFCRKM